MILIVSGLGSLSHGQQDIQYNITVLSEFDNYFDFHVEPTMAIAEDGTIYAGWKNADTHDGGGLRVSYTYSTDNGKNWEDPVLMDMFKAQGTGQSDPWMQVYHNTLYYAYLEYSDVLSQITISKTENRGQSWDLVDASDAVGFADKETFTIDSNGNIFLVYDDVLENSTTVRLSRSFDQGSSYTDSIFLNDTVSPNYVGPYITTGESYELFVAWSFLGEDPAQNDIYLDHSLDNGETWGTDQDLNPAYNASIFTSNPVSYRPEKVTLPVLEYDRSIGRLYVLWDDISSDIPNFDWDVYMKYSDDNGLTWSQRYKINTASSSAQWMPDFEIDSKGNLHIVYYSANSQGNYGLQYAIWNSTTDQISFRNQVSSQLTSAQYTRPGEYVSLRLDSEDIAHVVWTGEYQGKLDIFYTKLDPNIDYTSSSISSTSSKTTTTPVAKPQFVLTTIIVISVLRSKRKWHPHLS